MLRKTRQKFIPDEGLRLIVAQQGALETTLVIKLKSRPNVSGSAPGRHQPIQHGTVTHAKNPLHLEHAINKRETVGFIPLLPECGIRHQEFGGKSVCLFLVLP